MTVEPFRMRDFDATEDQLASFHQRMNIVTNANVNHGKRLRVKGKMLKAKGGFLNSHLALASNQSTKCEYVAVWSTFSRIQSADKAVRAPFRRHADFIFARFWRR